MPIATTADEALAAMDDKMQKPTAAKLATGFLCNYLAAGPKPSIEVMEAGKAAGHSEITLRRARAALKIQSRKNDMDGPWLLALPGTAFDGNCDAEELFKD